MLEKSVVSFCLRTSNVSTIITLNRNFTQWSKWLKPVVKSTLSCGRIDSCMVKLTGDPAIPYINLKRRVHQSASRRFAENSWVKRLLSEHKSSRKAAWQVAAVKSLNIMQDLKDSIISNFFLCRFNFGTGRQARLSALFRVVELWSSESTVKSESVSGETTIQILMRRSECSQL